MGEKVLELKNVFKMRGKRQVLKDINFSINKGEICGFVGRNGAGKTTLIKIITGMLSPDKGEIIICEKNLKNQREQALKNIGAVVETPEMYEYMTGRQNLNYVASVLENVTKNEVEDVIKFSNLGNKIDEKVKKYSLGMKQRLGLAQALMGNISLLILDEPTNGLDPMGVVELKKTINTLVEEKGVTVFISSHILSEIENICTKVVFIDDGKIISVQQMKDEFKVSDVKSMFIETNFSEKASEIIEKLSGVKLLKVVSDGIIVSIDNTLDDIFQILKELNSQGIKIRGFYEIKENLEEKFIKMMEGKE